MPTTGRSVCVPGLGGSKSDNYFLVIRTDSRFNEKQSRKSSSVGEAQGAKYPKWMTAKHGSMPILDPTSRPSLEAQKQASEQRTNRAL